MVKYSVAVPRNPRYIAVLVLCGLATVYFLSRQSPSQYFRGTSSGKSLKWMLIDEEQHYDKVLRDREAMVRKWGPTSGLVEAFPPKRDFYTLWDFFIPAFNCPHRVERIGTMGDGGKWVCGMDRIAKQKECVVYSFGVNGESSFEAEILERAPGCQIWGYDFSVSSFGPEIELVPELKERAHFYPYALGDVNNHGPGADPPVHTLASLMEVNGHNFIDILKIDIEGNEFTSLEKFLEFYTSGAGANRRYGRPPINAPPAAWKEPEVVLPIGQIQIEIHARTDTDYGTFSAFKGWWEKLEAAGLRPFWTEPNMVYVNLIRGARPDLVEYSFMNLRGNHALVSDRFDESRRRRE
ncbi:methyltransferase domain-containing protein [Sparassis latifolia]